MSKVNKRTNHNNKPRAKSQQPRKDSRKPRVNYDNTRKSKFDRDIRQEVDEGKEKPNRNDFDWYSKNPRLLAQAGSYPVASIVGSAINGKRGSQTRSVPGVMSFSWTPAIGPDSVAITQAANSMYSFDVHANSRNGSYDAPDLMISIEAGKDVFNIIGSMTRAYGFAKTYMEQNLYVPKEALKLMGFDPDSLQNSLGTAIFELNWLIAQTRQIWIPNTMPIADKQFKMNSLVFKDADTDRAQIYFFNQRLYKAFSGKEVETGSAVLPIKLTKAGEPTINPIATDTELFTPGAALSDGKAKTYHWGTWVKVAQFMIDSLVSMQDRGIMYGDILKAWGPEKIRSMPEIDINYSVIPQYNAEVQTQIENIVSTDFYQSAMFQSDGFIYPDWSSFQNKDHDACLPPERDALLNFHVNDVDAADIVIATRFVAAGRLKTDSLSLDLRGSRYAVNVQEKTVMTVCPTELVNEIMYATYFNDVSEGASVRAVNQFATIEHATTTNGMKLVDYLELMAFDWHPFIYDVNADGNDVVNIFGDFDNYTLVNTEALVNLNRACLFSLFDVPIM